VLAALVLPLLTLGLAAQELRIGFVDLARTFDQYHETIRSNAAIQNKRQAFRAQLEALQEELATLQEEREQYAKQAENMGLPQQAKDASQRTAEEKAFQLYQKEREFKRKLSTNEEELRRELKQSHDAIVEKLTKFIQDFGRERNYDLIINKSPSGPNSNIPVILYHPPEDDLTDQIIAGLNVGHEDYVERALSDGTEEAGEE
jgi:outer membrane protein